MTIDVNSFPLRYTPRTLGQIATGEITEATSAIADDDINYGRGVVKGSSDNNVKNIRNSQASLDFNADFVTGNTIDLKVNGVAIVQVPFDTNQATTKTNLITAIDNLDNVSAVDGGARIITITIDDGLSNADITDVVVAGGASQAGFTITTSTIDSLASVVADRKSQPATIGGDDKYFAGDQVKILAKGTLVVEVIAPVSKGEDVYINAAITSDDAQGKFTNLSTGNLLLKTAVFNETIAAATPAAPSLVEIKINRP
jgi:hypothetical protein